MSAQIMNEFKPQGNLSESSVIAKQNNPIILDIDIYKDMDTGIDKDIQKDEGEDKDKVKVKDSCTKPRTLAFSDIPELKDKISISLDGSVNIAGFKTLRPVRIVTDNKVNITGEIQTPELFLQCKSLNHYAIIQCQWLSIETLNDILIHPDANIHIQQDGYFLPMGKFVNRARVETMGKCVVMATLGIENFGNISAKKHLQLLSDSVGLIHNLGHLKSPKISVFHTGGFYNGPKASMEADVLKVQSKSVLINNGSMQGVVEVKVGSDGDIFNSGRINSPNKVKILGLESLKNNGHIIGGANISVQLKKEIFNEKGATLQSAFLSLGAFQLHNHGYLLGFQQFSLKSDSAINYETGIIRIPGRASWQVYSEAVNFGKICTQAFRIQTDLLSNQPGSSFQAAEELEILAEHFTNHKTAVFQSQSFIKANTQEFHNHGWMMAKKDLGLKTNMLQNTQVLLSKNKATICALQAIQLEGARLQAKDIQIEADTLENHGQMVAVKSNVINVVALQNLLKGLVFAGEKLACVVDAKLKNAGVLASKGSLTGKVAQGLYNQKTGQVVAGDALQLLIATLLENSGVIFSEKDALINAGDWLLNHLDASIGVKGNARLFARDFFENFGNIGSEGTLALVAERKATLNTLSTFRQGNAGSLQSGQDLSLLADNIENYGKIASKKNLHLEAKNLLENQATGELSAQDLLRLISYGTVRQGGVAKATAISAQAGNLIQMLANSQTFAKEWVHLNANHIEHHLGCLTAKQVILQAAEMLKLSGGIVFAEDLILNSLILFNRASLKANQASLFSHFLLNYLDGQISAHTLRSNSSYLSVNLGRVEAIDAQIASPFMVNTGVIQADRNLTFSIPTLYQQLNSGMLISKGNLQLSADYAYLAGVLHAKEDLTLMLRGLSYDEQTLWSARVMQLNLRAPFNFTRSLSVQGSLKIDAEYPMEVHAPIQATNSLHWQVPSLYIGNHGLQATDLSLEIAGPLHLERKTYCRSAGNLSAKAQRIYTEGEWLAEGNLALQAQTSISNGGIIASNSNINITAPVIFHARVSNDHAKPIIAASGSCILNGNTTVIEGAFSVRGQLANIGGFQYYSSESSSTISSTSPESLISPESLATTESFTSTQSPTSLTSLNAFNSSNTSSENNSPEAIEDARRHQKNKRKRAMYKNAVSVIVTSALPFILPGSHICLVVLRGALAGMTSSAIQGRNPLKGAFQEALLAGVGFGLNAGFSAALKSIPISTFAKTGLTVVATRAATTSVATAMCEGNYRQNLKINIAATIINHVLHANLNSGANSNTSANSNLSGVVYAGSMFSSIPNPIILTFAESMIESLITGAVTSKVTHTSLKENFLWSSIQGGINGLVHCAGPSVREAIYVGRDQVWQESLSASPRGLFSQNLDAPQSPSSQNKIPLPLPRPKTFTPFYRSKGSSVSANHRLLTNHGFSENFFENSILSSRLKELSISNITRNIASKSKINNRPSGNLNKIIVEKKLNHLNDDQKIQKFGNKSQSVQQTRQNRGILNKESDILNKVGEVCISALNFIVPAAEASTATATKFTGTTASAALKISPISMTTTIISTSRKSSTNSRAKSNNKLTPLERFREFMMLTERPLDRFSPGLGAKGLTEGKGLNYQFKSLSKFKHKLLHTLDSNQRHCLALEARHNVPAYASGCHEPMFYLFKLATHLIPETPKDIAFNIGVLSAVKSIKHIPPGLQWLYKEYKIFTGLKSFSKEEGLPHIFSKAKGGKEPTHGHIEDTPQNRRFLVETLIESRLVETNVNGVKTFAKHGPNGGEFWVEMRPNGKLRSAGFNEEPRFLKPKEQNK